MYEILFLNIIIIFSNPFINNILSLSLSFFLRRVYE